MGKNMSKDGFDHTTIMRVRTGPSQGDATERQMLDAIDDTGNFRTRLMLHPDGSTTRMKTKAGMPEFITDEAPPTEEETCTLKMDSGAVDLRSASIAHTNPLDDASGILWRTPYVQSVIVAPPINGVGPVVGKINPPRTAGVAPEDGTEAGSFLSSDSLGSAYDKKSIAARVPPSVFTGKMRQYIQALYGRHDHAEMLQVSSSIGTGLPPALHMDWNKTFDTYLSIDTNCGIYTDFVTWRHYLLCVGTSSVSIYRLVPDKCAEKLIPYLKSTEVSDGDKDRIEAYILSRSKPNIESRVDVSLPSAISNRSMGYGWHFNWDGTRCDIVHNTVVTAGGGGNENESVHLRLTFVFGESGWSVTPSTVEGPVRWKSLPYVDAIAAPNWSFMVLERFGANIGPLPYGNAPYYVFYARNELKVCRYSSTTANYTIDYYKSPWYWSPSGYYRVAGDSVDWQSYRTWTGRTVTISCGEDAVSYESGTKITDFYRCTAAELTGFWIVYGTATAPSYDTIESISGYPTYIPSSTIYDPTYGYMVVQGVVGSGEGGTSGMLYDTSSFGIGHGVYCDSARFEVIQTEESGVRTSIKTAQFITAIPFYDAEAVYAHGEKTEDTSELFDQLEAYGIGYDGLVQRGGGPICMWSRMYSVSGTSVDGTHGNDPVTGLTDSYSSESTSGLLVCNSGVFVDPALPGKSGFWSISDYIAQQYPTKASAAGESVIAPDNDISSGNPASIDIITPVVYVGWA